jgi:threonine dehydratase
MDLSLERIESASAEIDPVFLDTPQFVSDRLSDEFGREVVVKIETLNPIGSFKGRGTSLLGRKLDPSREWVCETAGNFGQGVAYAARKHGASVRIFVPPAAPEAKVQRMRDLGALVEVDDRPVPAAAEYAKADDRIHVVDGLDPATAEGAGTIGVELTKTDPVDTAVIQLGDGALITGIARWLKARIPQVKIVGVCPTGAPAMAQSFAAGRPISVTGEGTIAGAIAITDPVPESLERVVELVDEVVLVDDDDIRAAMALIADSIGVLVEPAGAAGVAALARHPEKVQGNRVAVLLTGAAA